VKIVLYQRWEEVEQLRDRWNPLLAQSATDTFFLSWEWLSSWWTAYGQGKSPFVIAAWDNQELVGIAPLCSDTVRRGGRSWKRLTYLGDGTSDSDYLDCFALQGKEEEFVAALVEHLRDHRDAWDCLDLHGPVETSPFAKAINSQLDTLGWTSAVEDVPCLSLKLPATWDEYTQSLKPRFRSKVRSALSFFEGTLKLKPIACTSEEQLDSWLPVFFELHGKRWQSKGKPGVFHGDEKRKFYSEMSRAALRAGALTFHRLDWGERPVAFQYGFTYGNRFLLLQEAYDPAFEHLRPGLALRAFRLRAMIAEGQSEYDFLAGVAQHKLDWGAEPKRATRLIATHSGAAAFTFVKAPAARLAIKESIRAVVPVRLLELRSKLRNHSGRRGPVASSTAASRPSRIKSALAAVYATAPVRRLGKWAADHYQRGNGSFSIETRKTPVSQIFLYHRVNDDGDPYLPSLPVQEFRRQMEYIAKNFRIVTLDDIAEGLAGADAAQYTVAITFDDGYRDNFTSAFPILKELGIPATIFLATGYVGTNKIPWYDQICLGFKLTTRKRFDMAQAGAPSGEIASESQRLAMLERVLDWLRELDNQERQRALPTVFRALGVPDSLTLPNYMLSWDEIKQMQAANIEFGAHTVSHPVLARTSGAQLQDEIAGSMKTIAQKLKTEVRHFAYPFGRETHYSNEARLFVEQCGFKSAVTTEFGFNVPGDDPFTLTRFTPWGHDMASFILQLDWYRFAGVRPSAAKVEMKAPPAGAEALRSRL
jgi:peptidoglycan/xylan/chitin deacetylase (PgdA/CDA1 family)/CelD/BcsL family acetyltransferase involved in cellulose biosynthesis